MKTIRWDSGKNEKLLKTRGISFNDILKAVDSGNLLAVIDNTSKNFGGQKLWVVRHKGYMYSVPFVETENEIFLKTIIPSWKLMKRFGGKK